MRDRFYQAGAWTWIATGAIHDALDVVTRISPPESEKAVNAAMRNQPFDYFGLSRSYYEVNMGISLGMGLAMVFVGVLFLFVGKVATDAGHARQAALVGLVMSLILLANSLAFEPPPPIITFGLASLFFAMAFRTRRHVVLTDPAVQVVGDQASAGALR